MSDRHLDRRALLLSGAGIASTAAVLRFDPAAGSTITKSSKGRFAPANKADWHYLPFDVPRGVRGPG